MENKKTLYQRVIIRPAAKAYTTMRQFNSDTPIELDAFSVYYVYQLLRDSHDVYYLIGPGTGGDNLVWVSGNDVLPWHQSEVAVLGERSGREPLLFFHDQQFDFLVKMVGEPGLSQKLNELSQEFQRYRKKEGMTYPDSFPVRGMEPPDTEGAVSRNRFYIMPIFEKRPSETQEGLNFLKVATIDPGKNYLTLTARGLNTSPKTTKKIGIAFVIDTTKSMGPYIESTRQISRRIYDSLDEDENAQNISLAFVAFRSSVDATPAIQYTTQLVTDFTSLNDRNSFEDALTRVNASDISTHSFNEDSFAGLIDAVKDLSWNSLDGGIIIMLTDAGPLELLDPYRSSNHTAESLKTLIETSYSNCRIEVIVIHLQTPEGAFNHSYARKAYNPLLFSAGGLDSYLPLEISRTSNATQLFENITNDFVNIFQMIINPEHPHRGEVMETSNEEIYNETLTPEEKNKRLAALIGYSYYLDYLGREEETSIPFVVDSWITDLDLHRLDQEHPEFVQTLDICVLLTRQQLDTLSKVLTALLEETKKSYDSHTTLNLFNALQSASSRLTRDPNDFVQNEDTPLSEMLIISEFLEGLPYKTRILTFNQRSWDAMMPLDRDIFIAELEAKLKQYQLFDSHLEGWGQFATDELDHVYRVPLSALP
ncbi:MAG: VWA domain-containing protein [Deltaproteobacteria bacterium]|nr:VWA domain-containing protein [Deltaproteobacteria bacterium]